MADGPDADLGRPVTLTTDDPPPPMPRYRSSGFGGMAQADADGKWVRYEDVLAMLAWLERQTKTILAVVAQ